MKPSFWERLDGQARALTPFGIAVLLALVNGLPSYTKGFVVVAPALPMMAIFHWSVYRPDLVPIHAVFTVGLLHDILAGTPLGVSALVYTVVYRGGVGQRRFLHGKSFLVVWLGFAVVALAAQAATWVAVSVMSMSPLIANGLIHQYFVTIGVFPSLAWGLIKWQRMVLDEET